MKRDPRTCWSRSGAWIRSGKDRIMNKITAAPPASIGVSPDAWAEGAQRLFEQYGVDLPTPDIPPFTAEWVDTFTYFVPWSVKLGASMDIGAALELGNELRALAARQVTLAEVERWASANGEDAVTVVGEILAGTRVVSRIV